MVITAISRPITTLHMEQDMLRKMMVGLMSLALFSVLFTNLVSADIHPLGATLNVTNVTIPPPPVQPTGMEAALLMSGQGLGGFLTVVQNPLYDFLLLIAVSIGTLGIFYGFICAIRKAFDTSPISPTVREDKYPIFTKSQRYSENDKFNK